MNTLQEKLVLSSTVVRQLVDLLGGDKSAVAEAARISVRNVEKALEDPRLLGKMAYDGLLYQCRKNLGDDEVRVAQRERDEANEALSVSTSLKHCSTCKEWKPLTSRYFYVRSASTDGFQSDCKGCHNELTTRSKAKGQNPQVANKHKNGPVVRTKVKGYTIEAIVDAIPDMSTVEIQPVGSVTEAVELSKLTDLVVLSESASISNQLLNIATRIEALEQRAAYADQLEAENQQLKDRLASMARKMEAFDSMRHILEQFHSGSEE